MTYHIADETHETSLGAHVVQPTAPLLAAMVAGAWLAWPWFAFNAIAMGSPTKKKEITLCVMAFAITAVLAAVLIALVQSELITSTLTIRLALLGITAFKLGISYYISTVQARTFHVYQYYKGNVRNAMPILGAGMLMRSVIVGLIAHPLWIIVVSGGI